MRLEGKVLIHFGFLIPAVVLALTPLLAMLLISFCNCRFPILPWPGWSFDWYQDFLANDELHHSIVRSAIVGFWAATISCIAGLAVGYEIARLRGATPLIIISVLTTPALIPGFLYGMGLAGLQNKLGIPPNLSTVVVAHAMIFSPIAIAVCYYRVRQLDSRIEDAALELGATHTYIIFSIVGRQIWPSLLAAFLFIFILSWDEYIVAWFVSGFDKTYPVHIRNMLESTVSPEINSAGVFISILSCTAFVLGILLLRRTTTELK